MNNTTRAEAVRYIMANKLTDFEKETMEQYFEMNRAEIEARICNLELNELNYKALSAINYLLKTL